jgi:hypothetical protein
MCHVADADGGVVCAMVDIPSFRQLGVVRVEGMSDSRLFWREEAASLLLPSKQSPLHDITRGCTDNRQPTPQPVPHIIMHVRKDERYTTQNKNKIFALFTHDVLIHRH